VFVHGFACAHSDWDAQVAHLSARHKTVAVDLRGHGASPGMAADCAVGRYGADVAEVMKALAMPPTVLVRPQHGMSRRRGGRLAGTGTHGRRGPHRWQRVRPAMEAMLKETFATANGFETLTHRWFQEMFTAKSEAAVVVSVVDRAATLPPSIGERLLMDMVRYDGGRLSTSLADVPLMAIQTTYSSEKRDRRSMTKGQTTPYLEMVRTSIPSVRIEIISDTGHFPQIDEAAQTNALLDGFRASPPAKLTGPSA
jgi:pimeloyl-ACP methyl ester carboxylesterase